MFAVVVGVDGVVVGALVLIVAFAFDIVAVAAGVGATVVGADGVVISCGALYGTKVDLSRLKRHRGAKDPSELEEVLSAYRKQLSDLQAEINQMTPNMRVSVFRAVELPHLYCAWYSYTAENVYRTLQRVLIPHCKWGSCLSVKRGACWTVSIVSSSSKIVWE